MGKTIVYLNDGSAAECDDMNFRLRENHVELNQEKASTIIPFASIKFIKKDRSGPENQEAKT